MTDIIATVSHKVAAGERLTDADALALFEHPDLIEIGRLADQVNQRKNRDVVFYNVNRHINPTNICALSCKFCAYSRKPGEEGGYAYSIAEMVQKAEEAVAQGATEVHMVGGLHPRWQLSHYKDMLAAIKAAFPQLHIKAFTAVELDWFARRARMTTKEVLLELKESGLGSLPGGGAEIFHPEIRDVICDTKVSAEQWLGTHRLAHELGMHSNCTMLYGHIESFAHRVDHMRRLRELQDETKGFNAFIPLAFQPHHNEMGINRYTFGYDDLKTLAVARLYLDNFRHIKAYWIMLGQDIAQLALRFGANDLDGTVIEEKISRMAGGRSGMAMSRSLIENLIERAGLLPCERDTLYRPVTALPTSTTRSPEVENRLRAALNKAAYGEALEHDELMILATDAPLHDLGRLAAQVPARLAAGARGEFAQTLVVPFAPDVKIGAAIEQVSADLAALAASGEAVPQTMVIDLGAVPPSQDQTPQRLDLGHLVELVWALRHSHPALDLQLLGLKALWRLCQDESVPLKALVARLGEAGVTQVGSSPHESETDLTHSEVVTLHRDVHQAELPSWAKVELTAPPFGAGTPQWDSFLRRLIALGGAARGGGHGVGLVGISIETSSGSLVTALEYLRAIALARLCARDVPVISAPLPRVPTLSPLRGEDGQAAAGQDPTEKLAPLCLQYGASDLGALRGRRYPAANVAELIRSVGLASALRGGGRCPSPAKDLRHVPVMAGD